MKTIRTSKGVFRYRPVYLYVGRKVIDPQVAFENLRELVPLLDGMGLYYGPFLGTLLGIVREHDFIEWDEDIDLYLLKEDEEAFLDGLWTLRDHGFELVRYDKRGLYSIMRNNEYIDFYILRKVSGELRNDGGPEFIFERYLQDTVDFDFKGVTLKIPREYDEWLTFLYGDWRTPVRYADYRMSKFRIFLGRIRWELKSMIPSWIYPFLVRLIRTKDARRFVEKCRVRGIEVKEEIRL